MIMLLPWRPKNLILNKISSFHLLLRQWGKDNLLHQKYTILLNNKLNLYYERIKIKK